MKESKEHTPRLVPQSMAAKICLIQRGTLGNWISRGHIKTHEIHGLNVKWVDWLEVADMAHKMRG